MLTSTCMFVTRQFVFAFRRQMMSQITMKIWWISWLVNKKESSTLSKWQSIFITIRMLDGHCSRQYWTWTLRHIIGLSIWIISTECWNTFFTFEYVFNVGNGFLKRTCVNYKIEASTCRVHLSRICKEIGLQLNIKYTTLLRRGLQTLVQGDRGSASVRQRLLHPALIAPVEDIYLATVELRNRLLQSLYASPPRRWPRQAWLQKNPIAFCLYIFILGRFEIVVWIILRWFFTEPLIEINLLSENSSIFNPKT